MTDSLPTQSATLIEYRQVTEKSLGPRESRVERTERVLAGGPGQARDLIAWYAENPTPGLRVWFERREGHITYDPWENFNG